MKTIPMKHAETSLETAALEWLNEQGEDYDTGAAGAYSDLMQGGCQSGIVGNLIYYNDTLAFYAQHQQEIDRLLSETCTDLGAAPLELFGAETWDADDPLARDTNNRNLLAWFGFEEAARTVASRAGIDD